MSKKKSAIVIGSGIAGMATAIRLACHGFDVEVFEKNAYPGGKLSMFQQDGFSFDEGPSLFTQPSLIEELFQLSGEPISDYFSYQPVSISCKYFFENGKIIHGYASAEKFANELQDKAGEPKQNTLKYLKRAQQLFKNVGSIFLNHSLHQMKTWFNTRIFSAVKSTRFPYLFQTLDHYNGTQFTTSEARQIFNRYATYNGSNPYQAPAMLSLIPHLEISDGTYYPTGGMISITNALYALACKKAVQFHFNAPVEKIVTEGNSAKGILVAGKLQQADVLISNIDAYFTYQHLLDKPAMAGNILKQERSSSALIFYWGIGKIFPQLQLHNIFFSENYQEEFACIFKKGMVYEDPTVYVNVTSTQEASQAPPGKQNWFVMVNVPANTGQDWNVIQKAVRKNVIKKLSRLLSADIEPLIEVEKLMDPVIIEQKTGSYMGSLYGTSSNGKMAAFFRHPNFSRDIKNLYHCGGSVHPGGGIPLCLKSAAITSRIILEQQTQPTR